MRFLHTADPLIIHGDLKAANVLLDTRFRAKVADFGLSHNKRHLGVTGTPFWMAPELLRGDAENNPTTDVYSFGSKCCSVLPMNAIQQFSLLTVFFIQ